MKALTIPIAALVLITGLAIFEHFYVVKKFDDFEERLEQLYTETKAKTATTEKVAEVETWWDKQKSKLHIFTPHSIIKDIDYWLAETRGYINVGNFEFALVKIDVIKIAAKAIPKSFVLDMGNIF